MDHEFVTVLKAAAERDLPSLLIGGNAVIVLGYIRNTADLDLLIPESSRSEWLDLLRDLGFRLFYERRRSCKWSRSIAADLPWT